MRDGQRKGSGQGVWGGDVSRRVGENQEWEQVGHREERGFGKEGVLTRAQTAERWRRVRTGKVSTQPGSEGGVATVG